MPRPNPPSAEPAASGPGSETENNREKLAEALRQREARFEQRTDEVIAQLYQARAEAARLQEDTQRHLQASQQIRRDHEQCLRDYEVLRSLLQASQDALLRKRPLTPEQRRQIDAALRPGGLPSTDQELAA